MFLSFSFLNFNKKSILLLTESFFFTRTSTLGLRILSYFVRLSEAIEVIYCFKLESNLFLATRPSVMGPFSHFFPLSTKV